MFQFSENIIPMADVKRPNVRRRLPFTDTDRTKMISTLDKQEKEMDESERNRFKERWSFDPVAGNFLPNGKYECLPIDPATTPSFYQKGYPPRKTKPMRRLPEEMTEILFSRRPESSLVSAKRKLDLSDEHVDYVENDENQDVTKSTFVQSQQLWNRNANESLPSRCKSSAKDGITSSTSEITSSPSHLCESPLDDSHGLCRTNSSPSLHELSPTTKEKDIVTPPTRSKSLTLTQSSIKDYLPLKKSRISKTLSSHSRP